MHTSTYSSEAKMSKEQTDREAQRQKAKDRKREEGAAVRDQVLAAVRIAEENAHKQLKLAQDCSTAVPESLEAVGAVGETGKDSVKCHPNSEIYLDKGPASAAVAAVTTSFGRPSEFSDVEADRICSWIAEGRSLKSYCRLEHRSMETVYRWLRERRDFRERYARAHDDRADSLADELTDIADDVTQGTMEQIQAARLRVDTRKWIASKLKPLKWGEYVADTAKTNVTFNIGIRPIHSVIAQSVSEATDLQPRLADIESDCPPKGQQLS
jgi:hypothetical protein